MRLNKYLAACGLASRRGAETLIDSGRISVNGEVVASPAISVSAEDAVCCDGKEVHPATQARLWRYYKPVGLVCTHRYGQGRPTVFDALPATLGRVMSVGRLDLNSEGLLLLTNSGELARTLEHPATGAERSYRVRIRGRLAGHALEQIREGVTIDGMAYQPVAVEEEKAGQSNSWLRMTLHEGKNREIRRICEHFGHPVNRLIRTGYGEVTLEGMQPGEVTEVPPAHPVWRLVRKAQAS